MTKRLTIWQQIGIALSSLWMLGVIGFASVEFAKLPVPLNANPGPPRSTYFFDWLPETAQHHDVPGIGTVVFPASMPRSAVVDALRRNYPETFARVEREVKWDIQVDKPSTYYNITPRFGRMALLLLVPIVIGWLLVGTLVTTVTWLSKNTDQN